jgi:hypothetical protein
MIEADMIDIETDSFIATVCRNTIRAGARIGELIERRRRRLSMR